MRRNPKALILFVGIVGLSIVTVLQGSENLQKMFVITTDNNIPRTSLAIGTADSSTNIITTSDGIFSSSSSTPATKTTFINITKSSPSESPIDAEAALESKPSTTEAVRSNEQPSSPQSPQNDQTIGYIKMRSDRYGSVIHDMLHAHAYCFQNSCKFGGACVESKKSRAASRSPVTMKLIQFLGLEVELPQACPSSSDTNSYGNREIYLTNYGSDKLFTTEWIRHIQSLRNTTMDNKHKKQWIQQHVDYNDDDDSPSLSQQQQVAVYIRRGDVGPCTMFGNNKSRYLPNSYYLRVLEQYVLSTHNINTVNVTVYTESRSRGENYDIFHKRGYNLALDYSITDVWNAIMIADYVILSRSSFSYVPAVFNLRGQILYTDFWHLPLPGWVRINQTWINQADQEMYERYHC